LDVQSYRNSSTQVASGASSSAVGYDNRAFGTSSSAFGYNNNAAAFKSSTFGYSNEALGDQSSAFGYNNTSLGFYSSAFGYGNTASGSGSSVVGKSNNTQGDNSSLFGNANREIGTASWFNNSLFGYDNEITSGGSGSGFSIQNLTVVGYKNSWTQYTSIQAATAIGYQNKPQGSYSSLVGASNEEAGPTSASFTKNSLFGYDNVITAGSGSGLSVSNCTVVGYQNSWTQNTSLSNATAVGHSNTASGNYGSSALGYGNQALGDRSTAVGHENETEGGSANAFGRGNTAFGNFSCAVGFSNDIQGNLSTAIGYDNSVSGLRSSVIGVRVKTTVNETFEAGYWSNSTTRQNAIRIHPNGQVAMTIEDSASIPDDGGATAGGEADGSLPRGMFAIQKNGNAVTLYYNNGGSIQSLSLGTLS
jgi:hypothetical protein